MVIEPALYVPSPRYAAAALARNGGFYLASLASVPLLALWNGWAPLAALPIVGLAMYRLTMIMHDCLHGTLFTSAKVNRAVGITAGALSGIEFHAFARLHRRHHAIVGQPDDPQGPDYLLPQSATLSQIVGHLLNPLLGCNLYKLQQVFRQLDDARPARYWRYLATVVVAQMLAAAMVSRGFTDWWLALLPVAGAATFGLFFAQLRGFVEHVAMPGVDAPGFVRSHRPNWIDRVFLYDLNFNLHREHHQYPTVPSCRLPELQRRLAGYEMPSDSMLTTVRRRIAAAMRPAAKAVT
jgi:beta-carotene hydroxylase